MAVYVVESVSDCDGGYLPDTRRILGIFSSEEDADSWVSKHESDYNHYEVSEYELDNLLSEDSD